MPRIRLRRAAMIGLVCCAAFAPGSPFTAAETTGTADERRIRFEDFVGAETCGSCHRAPYDSWRQSTHGRAGGDATRDVVISQFDGQVLTFADAEVRLEIDDKERFVFHVDRPGAPLQSFQVAGFVGGGHMLGGGTQTAFTRYSDGSWRLLPFDYSRHSDLWFCDTGGDKRWAEITPSLSIDECRFWPPVNNFSPNCGNCHSSQLDSRYDRERNREELRFVSLAINCESCHGPGRRHVELMQRADREELTDIGLTPLDLLDKQASVDTCFRCHALTTRLAPGYLPGKPLRDYYALNFYPAGRRTPDGRVIGFGYQEGHLYSDCYLNGSMTCVDCHAPHSLAYRDTDGFALQGKLDDGQCTDCHPAKLDNVSAHTGHPSASPGSRCVACHMPFLQHAAVGPAVRFARSDHTISIPRPALDAALGLENACSACHGDRSVAWQQAQVDDWHGISKPHNPAVGSVFELRQLRSADAIRRLLTRDIQPHPAAQVDLLREAGRRLGLPATRLTGELQTVLERWVGEGTQDARALARAWLLAAGALDREEVARLPVAERRRTGTWLALESQLVPGTAGLARRVELMELAVGLNPDDSVTRFRLAEAYRATGALPEALTTLRQVSGEQIRSAAEHGQLMTGMCATLDELVARGMPRSDAIRRVCSAEGRQAAAPVFTE